MKKISENLKQFFESKVSIKILYVIGIALSAMLIFSAGVFVGVYKDSFEHAWGEHYMDNFGMLDHHRLGFSNLNNFPNAHGAVGKIIKIELPSIIVQDKDNLEKVVLLTDDTKIQRLRENINMNDLKLNDFAVVIGTPNTQGEIEAKFIRVMPSPNFLTPIKSNATTPK